METEYILTLILRRGENEITRKMRFENLPYPTSVETIAEDMVDTLEKTQKPL